MKISVELSENELREICRVTGEAKKGPAIRKLLLDALMLKRRAKLAERFISGEWGVELAGYEKGKSTDVSKSVARSKAWRSR
jgi:hypothetical protein